MTRQKFDPIPYFAVALLIAIACVLAGGNGWIWQ